MDRRTVARLENVYEHVDDIDLFPGGMAEKPVVGGIVGRSQCVDSGSGHELDSDTNQARPLPASWASSSSTCGRETGSGTRMGITQAPSPPDSSRSRAIQSK